MEEKQKCEIIPYPKVREGVTDLMKIGMKTPLIHFLIEIDVTDSRCLLREYKERTGQSISFQGYLINCLAKVVDENKIFHAMKKGKHDLMLFDEVDISMMIERDFPEIPGYPKLPKSYIIRNANHKALQEINAEIQEAKKMDVHNSIQAVKLKKYLALPKFIRNILVKKMTSEPLLRKNFAGTVGVTGGAFSGATGVHAGWFTPITPMTITMAVGFLVEKPGIIDGKPEAREILGITFSFDHLIIDGGPATRFITRFTELVKNCYGLKDLIKN